MSYPTLSLTLRRAVEFVLRDAIGDQLSSACEELNLETIDGDAAEPVFDFDEVYGRFKVGEDLTFSLEVALRSKGDSSSSDPSAEPATDVAATETTGRVVAD